MGTTVTQARVENRSQTACDTSLILLMCGRLLSNLLRVEFVFGLESLSLIDNSYVLTYSSYLLVLVTYYWQMCLLHRCSDPSVSILGTQEHHILQESQP